MRFTQFALALVFAAAEARSRRGSTRSSRDNSLSNGDTERFMAWAAMQGKSFSNTKEFAARLSIWKDVDKIIQSTNA